jgi:3-oxoacyl-[acyl-carrier protein] reductase
MFQFQGKKVLVTGGSRGIGSQIALDFAQSGADITITATSQASVDEFRKENSELKFRSYIVNFSKLDETEKFLKNIESEIFDILVNNAGINKINLLTDIKLQDWQNIQDVNLRAPFLVSQCVAKGMIKKKSGRIINMASIFGMVTKEERLSYTTSKAGLLGMTKTLALELAHHNILVNAVSPGFIDTELTRRVLGDSGIIEMTKRVPLNRLGTAKDVSNVVLFLASELNQFITGENMVIDGGFTCA